MASTSALALLTTSVLWGLSPPIIKYTLGFISPELFLFWRFLIAFGLIIVPLILFLKKNPDQLKHLKKIIFFSFLGTPLNLYLLFLGIKRTTAIDASIISIISPILIIMGGAFFLKEKVTKTEKIGVSLALLGTIITIIQPLFESGVNFQQNLKGNLFVLAGVVVWATFSILVKREGKNKIRPFTLSSFSFLIGFLFFLPLGWQQNFALSPQAIPGIVFMALFGSIIAFTAFVQALRLLPMSVVFTYGYVNPVIAVVAGFLILKEPITLTTVAGAALVFLGVGGVFRDKYAAQGKKARQRSTQPADALD